MMRTLVLSLSVVAASACSGVSETPGPAWNESLAAYAEAHCAWNHTCDGRSDTTCVAAVTGIMNDNLRDEIPAELEDACISCMEAWTAAYVAATSPCASALTFEQAQSIGMACVMIDCVELHDLPGSSPQ